MLTQEEVIKVVRMLCAVQGSLERMGESRGQNELALEAEAVKRCLDIIQQSHPLRRQDFGYTMEGE